jgi:hypothetical protein
MNYNQNERREEASVSQGAIVFCAVSSALYTFSLGIMPPIMLPIPFAPFRWLLGLVSLGLCFWLYPSLHAHVGQEFATVAIHLSRRVDSIYGLAEKDKWGDWTRDGTIMFGTHWPLTWIWVVFLGVAVVIGQSFKSVWKI